MLCPHLERQIKLRPEVRYVVLLNERLEVFDGLDVVVCANGRRALTQETDELVHHNRVFQEVLANARRVPNRSGDSVR